jgi:hypothetical protein
MRLAISPELGVILGELLTEQFDDLGQFFGGRHVTRSL